jgi:hypothetical protein
MKVTMDHFVTSFVRSAVLKVVPQENAGGHKQEESFGEEKL